MGKLGRIAPIIATLFWCLGIPNALAEGQQLDEQSLNGLLTDNAGSPYQLEGELVLKTVQVEPGRAHLIYETPRGEPFKVVLVPKDSAEPHFKTTASFKIFYPDPCPENAACVKLLEGLAQHIAARDTGQWSLPPIPAESGNPSGSQRGRLSIADSSLFLFGTVLLILSLLFLPSLLAITYGQFRTLPHKLPILGIIGAGAVLRLFVMRHMVITVYMGYLLTDKAASLREFARYGIGSQAMWHHLFHFTTPDHTSAIMLNACLGILSMGLLVALLRRAGYGGIGILSSILLMAFLPVLLWSDCSDSLTVVVLFWTFGATVFAQEYLISRKIHHLLGALVWLVMAAHTRPEQGFFGPLFVLTVIMFQPGSIREKLKLPWYAWLISIGGFILLVLPQISLALDQKDQLIQLGSWPHRFAEIIPLLPDRWLHENALLESRYVPSMLLPLAVLGLVIASSWERRRFRLAICILGWIWLSFYYIDLSAASGPRLHIVMVIPAILAIGGLCEDLWAWRSRRWPSKPWIGPALAVACLGAVGVTMPPSLEWFTQDTNEWEEDVFFRAAVSTIDDSSFTLLRVGFADLGEADYTHQHHPDYLVRPPHRNGKTQAITSFIEKSEQHKATEGPVYFYLGLRCYSRERWNNEPAPHEYFRPACRRIMKEYDHTLVYPADGPKVVPNHGDLALKYYADRKTQPTFQLGLYRIGKRLNKH